MVSIVGFVHKKRYYALSPSSKVYKWVVININLKNTVGIPFDGLASISSFTDSNPRRRTLLHEINCSTCVYWILKLT